MQIKCLLELNCLCVLFVLTQHVHSSLSGPGWWKVSTMYAVKGCYEMDLLLTAVGVENRARISSGAPFYNGRHVTPRGCCCSMKQDHQFLNKISTQLSAYPDRLVFMCFFGIFRSFPLSARKHSWKFGFITVT